MKGRIIEIPPHGDTATVVLETSRSCSRIVMPEKSVDTMVAMEEKADRTAACTRLKLAMIRRPFLATSRMVCRVGGTSGAMPCAASTCARYRAMRGSLPLLRASRLKESKVPPTSSFSKHTGRVPSRRPVAPDTGAPRATASRVCGSSEAWPIRGARKAAANLRQTDDDVARLPRCEHGVVRRMRSAGV
eukprot:scaffold33238_cov129-Isochrysis_galbana.AAC.3